MAGRIKRVVSVYLLIMLVLCFVGCDIKSADELIGSAASSFAEGKETEPFVLPNGESVLDEQMQLFVGSYYRPSEKQLTDDEFIDLMRQLGNPDFNLDDFISGPTSIPTEYNDDQTGITTETSSVVPTDKNIVSSIDDLKRVIHQALDKTETNVDFYFADGFYVDLKEKINYISDSIQREDPIDGVGIDSWEWWQRGNYYSLCIIYSFDIDELKIMKRETQKLVDEAVNNIQPSNMTDYEIVNAVNDYLCDKVEYPDAEPYEPVTHTAYGALNNGCAVCEGYACATKLILSEFGVESDIEIGECNDGGLHAWNLVKVDGVWYQLDVCWNDGSRVRHKYFLVDDNYMHQTRHWEEIYYPVCSDARYVA